MPVEFITESFGESRKFRDLNSATLLISKRMNCLVEINFAEWYTMRNTTVRCSKSGNSFLTYLVSASNKTTKIEIVTVIVVWKIDLNTEKIRQYNTKSMHTR